MNLGDRIRLGFDRFNARDWEALAAGLPEHFEAIDRVPPDELRVVGPDALRQITEANGDTAFADLRMHPSNSAPWTRRANPPNAKLCSI